jgi:hypothetical protein
VLVVGGVVEVVVLVVTHILLRLKFTLLTVLSNKFLVITVTLYNPGGALLQVKYNPLPLILKKSLSAPAKSNVNGSQNDALIAISETL